MKVSVFREARVLELHLLGGQSSAVHVDLATSEIYHFSGICLVIIR